MGEEHENVWDQTIWGKGIEIQQTITVYLMSLDTSVLNYLDKKKTPLQWSTYQGVEIGDNNEVNEPKKMNTFYINSYICDKQIGVDKHRKGGGQVFPLKTA